MQGHNESVKPGDAVQPQVQGEPKFTNEGNRQQAIGNGVDTGCPSMLEELMVGKPGCFVSVKGEVPKSQRGGVAECIRNSTTRPLDHSATSSVDGGFITGPGLDDAAKVVGVVDTIAHCPLPNSCLPDHRAYDAAVKAERQKQEAARAVASMLCAREAMLSAWRRLAGMDVEAANAAVVAAGIDRLLVVAAPCPCSDPCCTSKRTMAQVSVQIGNGTWVQLLWEVA